tara:strand:+ start:220 stop:687 length:468 start_codon:yes stop_codon:yes gene_type:complete
MKMELPFNISKRHKANTRMNWKKRDIEFRDDGHFQFVYHEYIHAKNCELCNKLFTNSKDRHLDHSHITKQPRYIVCQCCNNKQIDRKKNPSNTGKTYISKRKDKRYADGHYFRVEIKIDYKKILNTARITLEAAILCRDEFIESHPEFNLTTADI